MGLVINGKMIDFEHGERIRDGRGVGAWWGHNEYGTGPRQGEINIFTGHWTAGEAGTRDPDGAGPLTEYDDDGPRVVRVMKARESKKVPGRKLQVSVQFVIGACPPDALMAPIWQTMDLALNTAIHVGDRVINRRSLSFECVNSGMPGGPMDLRDRPWHVRKIAGRNVKVAEFFRGQINAMVWLAQVLTSHAEDSALGEALRGARIRIPRQVPVRNGELLAERFSRKLAREWKGLMEHLHSPTTKKVDAGLQFVESCRGAGFHAVEV